MTFEEAYCARHRCDPARFRAALFWGGIPRRLRLIAVVSRLVNRRIFGPDLHFIVGLSETQSVEQVRTEARAYLQMPENRRWSRRVLKLRISATRLIHLAKDYLPERGRVGP